MFRSIAISLTIIFLVGCTTTRSNLTPLPTSLVSSKKSIDTRDKIVTTYILYQAVKALEEMDRGDVLEIITSNFPGIENDVQAWSRMTGHKRLEVIKHDNSLVFYVEKSKPIQRGKSLAMVLSNPGLEELLSPLGFALGAEIEGIDVHIYFQGPAVKVLEEGFKEKLGGINWIFSGFARDGLRKIGHIPAQEKLKQLQALGAKFYICTPSMDHFGVRKDDIAFNDVAMAEYFTFMEVMDKADIHIFTQ